MPDCEYCGYQAPNADALAFHEDACAQRHYDEAYESEYEEASRDGSLDV